MVAPIRKTTAWRETSGCPRQLRAMKLNRLCSIWFYLLVAGGKWQTSIARPVAITSGVPIRPHGISASTS